MLPHELTRDVSYEMADLATINVSLCGCYNAPLRYLTIKQITLNYTRIKAPCAVQFTMLTLLLAASFYDRLGLYEAEQHVTARAVT